MIFKWFHENLHPISQNKNPIYHYVHTHLFSTIIKIIFPNSNTSHYSSNKIKHIIRPQSQNPQFFLFQIFILHFWSYLNFKPHTNLYLLTLNANNKKYRKFKGPTLQIKKKNINKIVLYTWTKPLKFYFRKNKIPVLEAVNFSFT